MREDGGTQRRRHFLQGHHERFLSQLRDLQLTCASTRMASGQGDAQRLAHNRPHRQALVRQVGEHDRSIDLPGEHLSSKIIRDDFAQVQHDFWIGGAAIAIVLIELGLQTERTPCRKAPSRHSPWRLAATHRVKAPVAADPDLVARCARVYAAADARPNGGSACCAADRHRPVHARGVLSTRSAHHVADDSLVDGGFARVFVLTAILYAPKQVKDLIR